PAPAVPVAGSAVPAPAPVKTETAKPQAAAQTPGTRAAPNYKESGSPDAPITCEIYSDYECPHCAVFFRDTLPMLVADYVRTGKVKVLHRDFPLPQHPYAKLAARYANAAGQAGRYDAAVTQLFKTQDVWSKNGDVDTQLAAVLSPAVMRKVREFVEHDQQLDDTVTADQAMGVKDNLTATPTLVVVWKGKRQNISPIPSYTLLKSYLDDLLAQH
ncbi:MAG TPA: thioredoxin domain-containing protein, partial [Bryobacteraceae bacterium]